VFAINSFAQQQPIEVTEQTLKIGAKDEHFIYCGFAAGDKIIFDFQEINGKKIKEVEILEYPESSKFSDFETKEISNKTINVSKQSIYVFRFKNNAVVGRVCKVKIQRIPANETTANFNTNIAWQQKQDTTYRSYTKDIIVGYDTMYLQKIRKEIVSQEISDEMIINNREERVHAGAENDANIIQIRFPQEQIFSNQTKKIIKWAYFIGTNNEGKQAWNSLFKLGSGITSKFSVNPLTKLALGAFSKSDIQLPIKGSNVKYCFFNSILSGTCFDNGDVVSTVGYHTTNKEGTIFLRLYNDNIIQSIDVFINVSIIWETIIYQDVPYTEMKVTPRYEKKIFKEPIITTKKIPVFE
jgi:hypothetical protein